MSLQNKQKYNQYRKISELKHSWHSLSEVSGQVWYRDLLFMASLLQIVSFQVHLLQLFLESGKHIELFFLESNFLKVLLHIRLKCLSPLAFYLEVGKQHRPKQSRNTVQAESVNEFDHISLPFLLRVVKQVITFICLISCFFCFILRCF